LAFGFAAAFTFAAGRARTTGRSADAAASSCASGSGFDTKTVAAQANEMSRIYVDNKGVWRVRKQKRSWITLRGAL
jgi:hypothetical protein